MPHPILVMLAALAAGAIAAVSGFGIGSLLRPLFAGTMGTKAAVAVVSIPHCMGTTLRFLLMRKYLDRQILHPGD